MNSELSSMMQRRGQLLATIAMQRKEMSSIQAGLQGSLKWVDRGLTVVRFLRDNPLLIAGVVAVLVTRRRSVAGVIRAGLRVWNEYRNLAGIASGLGL